MEKEETGITEEVANFVRNIRYEDFPPEVRHMAKRCIIDGIGVILAGSEEACTLIIRDYILAIDGRHESLLLGKGRNRAPAPLAALVNGTGGHALDWDDTVLSTTPDRSVLLHPTLLPLAAGLAIGEKLETSGRDLLTAFITGFEVECKIAECIHPDHWVRGFHTSNTCGIFGATAAAAKLRGLSAKQVRSALGIAASMAAGIIVNLGTMVKPLHMGRAAEDGIISAQLAELGYEGHPEALEGHKGFFHAFAGGFDPNKIQGKLGRPFSIVDPGVSIKPYPCGVVGHSAMDAMQALVVQHDLRPGNVAHVKVSTGSNVLPPKGPLRYKKAQTALQGKFCVPFQMASMIIRRKAGRREFTDEFVQSSMVQEMMDRVEAVIDPEIDALGGDKIVGLIELQLKDGKTIRGKSAEYYRGGPLNPLTREELGEKFNDCVHEILTPVQASKLMETIESLENLDSVRGLSEMAAVS
jgi:2-methylcitrate dehydratase PrpD